MNIRKSILFDQMRIKITPAIDPKDARYIYKILSEEQTTGLIRMQNKSLNTTPFVSLPQT